MGSYDSVHTGSRCGQTKAFGKGFRDLVPGDRVALCPATRSALDVESFPGSFVMAPVALEDFQVAVLGGGFLVVRGGVLVDWATDAAADLPVFDNLGHPSDLRENPSPAPSGGTAPSSSALLDALFGAPSPEERAARDAEVLEEEDRLLRGLPGSCPVCAALRAV